MLALEDDKRVISSSPAEAVIRLFQDLPPEYTDFPGKLCQKFLIHRADNTVFQCLRSKDIYDFKQIKTSDKITRTIDIHDLFATVRCMGENFELTFADNIQHCRDRRYGR